MFLIFYSLYMLIICTTIFSLGMKYLNKTLKKMNKFSDRSLSDMVDISQTRKSNLSLTPSP